MNIHLTNKLNLKNHLIQQLIIDHYEEPFDDYLFEICYKKVCDDTSEYEQENNIICSYNYIFDDLITLYYEIGSCDYKSATFFDEDHYEYEFCCEDDNVAAYGCSDCNDVYCKECANGHADKKKYKGHKVVSLEEYKNTTTTTTSTSSTPHSRIIRHCDFHKHKVLELFCVEEQSLICPLCITTNGKHAKHDCVSVKEASIDILKSTEELEKQINKIYEDMLKLKQQLLEQSEEHKKVKSKYMFFINSLNFLFYIFICSYL